MSSSIVVSLWVSLRLQCSLREEEDSALHDDAITITVPKCGVTSTYQNSTLRKYPYSVLEGLASDMPVITNLYICKLCTAPWLHPTLCIDSEAAATCYATDSEVQSVFFESEITVQLANPAVNVNNMYLIDASIDSHMKQHSDSVVVSTLKLNGVQAVHTQLISNITAIGMDFSIFGNHVTALTSPLMASTSPMAYLWPHLGKQTVLKKMLPDAKFNLPLLILLVLSSFFVVFIAALKSGGRHQFAVLMVIHVSCSIPAASCLPFSDDYRPSINQTMKVSHGTVFVSRYNKRDTPGVFKVQLVGSPNAGYCVPISIGIDHPQQVYKPALCMTQ